MRGLEGQVAVVTGASSGHGRATSLRLAEEGAAVVCADLQPGARQDGFEVDLEVDTHELIERGGGRAAFAACDVTDEASLRAVADLAVERFGRLDAWVNNAGVFLGLKPLLEETPAQYRKTMEVNLDGTWYGCRAAVAKMLEQEPRGRSRGRIVNIGSVAGEFGQADIGGYSASKGAVHNLTRALAIELAPQLINVNAIAPGYFPTGMNRTFWDDPEALKAVEELHPLPLGVPDDIAAGVAFLASDDAAFITGTILPIDGGVLAK